MNLTEKVLTISSRNDLVKQITQKLFRQLLLSKQCHAFNVFRTPLRHVNDFSLIPHFNNPLKRLTLHLHQTKTWQE